MGHIGAPEIIIVVLVVLIFFGAKKIPEIGQAIGKAIAEFKRSSKDPEDKTDAK